MGSMIPQQNLLWGQIAVLPTTAGAYLRCISRGRLRESEGREKLRKFVFIEVEPNIIKCINLRHRRL